MRTVTRTSAFLALAVALAVTGVFSLVETKARTNGTYTCVATKLKFRDPGGPIDLPDTQLQLTLPHTEGRKMSARLFSAQSGAFLRRIKIHGRVREATVRQGGKKHEFRGFWVWKFKVVGQEQNARGNFRFQIEQVIDNSVTPPAIAYTVRGPIKVDYLPKVAAKAGDRYSVRGRFTGFKP
jgi:hypothetical protein